MTEFSKLSVFKTKNNKIVDGDSKIYKTVQNLSNSKKPKK